MKKIWKDVLILSVIAGSVVLVILLLIRFTPRPPVGKMDYARESLFRAGTNKANTYSKRQYTEAKIFYDSAMVNWQKENKRFIYFRHYDKVAMFAELSAKKASQATDNSISNSSNLRIDLKQKIESLEDLVIQIDEHFTNYPLTSEIRDRISNGKMLLKEAEIVYSKSEYFKANRKITDAEYLLTQSYENASADLKNYFKSFSVWKRWVDKTLNESRKNHDYSIIIDKFSRKCFVYLEGSRKYEFEAELGKNWVGGKRVKGDFATPEGMYKIARKFEGFKTKYYKALLLDYPNDEDKEKFKSEIAHGSLPASAKIGGMIEIHGNGGKGIDWTQGCIALTDKEMDIVYNIAKVGTPVTIIGSMVDLKDVVER
jgi:L,D-transpeptidase catalytic domain